MKDIDEINKDLLFRQVYQILNKEYGTLPTEGVIAGQAVASAIFKMLSLTKNPPFNDLDIFTDHSEYPNFYPEGDERSQRSGTMSLAKVSGANAYRIMNSGSFDVDMGSIDQTSYTIHNCDYDPNNPRLNYVLTSIVRSQVSFDKHADVINVQGMNRSHTIIKSFDINCCQAAIDLRDQTIHWTDAFKDFLYQKELKVKYFGTPMHTAIRILKKNDDIDFAKLDIDSEMKKLQTARAIFAEVESAKEEDRQFVPGNLFSLMYKRRYKDREDVLSKYFSLEEKVVAWHEEKKLFHVMAPKSYNEETLKLYRRLYSFQVTSSEEVPKLSNMMMDSVISDFENLYNHANANSKKSRKVDKFIDELRKDTLIGQYGMMSFYKFLAINSILDKDFSFNGYTKDVYNMMSKFYDKHPRAIARLARYPIETIVKCIQNMRWADNNKLGFIIGEIEDRGVYAESDKFIDAYLYAAKNSDNSYFYEDQAKRFISIREGDDKEEMISIEELSSNAFKTKARKMFAAKKERMSKNSSYPIMNEELSVICDKAKMNVSITELNDEFLLYLEGEKMKHCVGGYWRSVQEGGSYIFGITIEGDEGIEHSTLEIKHMLNAVNEGTDDIDFVDVIDVQDMPMNNNSMISDSGFSIRQHRGKLNQEISEESRQVGRAILKVMASKKLDMYKKYNGLSMIDHINGIVEYDKAIKYLEDNEVDGFEKLYIRNFSRERHLEVPKGFVKSDVGLNRINRGFPDLAVIIDNEELDVEAAM